jgi:hypothetical protein
MYRVIATVAMGLLATATCHAREDMQNGVYIGVDGGRANASGACNGAPGGISSCATNGTAVGAVIGYHFLHFLSVEGGYHSFGTYDVIGSPAFPINGSTKLSGVEVAAIGNFPIGAGFGFITRAGAAATQVKETAVVVGYGQSVSQSATTAGGLVGVGLRYVFSPQLQARLLINYYGTVGNSTTGQAKLSAYTAGLTYTF